MFNNKKHKFIFLLATSFLFMTSISFANSRVFFDAEDHKYMQENRNMTVAVNGIVESEKGEILGTGSSKVSFCQGCIPISRERKNFISSLKRINGETPLGFKISEKNEELEFFTDGKYVFFKVAKPSIKKTKIRLEILSSENRPVVRAYLVDSDQYFKIISPYIEHDIHGKIYENHEKVSDIRAGYILEASKMIKILEKKNYIKNLGKENSSRAALRDVTYRVDNIPKNINGNQGQFKIDHTIGGYGHVVPKVKYVSGSSHMRSINVGFYLNATYDIYLDSYMDLKKGQIVTMNASMSSNDELRLKLSTQYNPGYARVRVFEALR